MHDPQDLRESVKRLADGSTVGMVDAELKQKGVASGPRDEVLELAKRIINRRARIKHSIIFMAGVLVFSAGTYWLYHCIQNEIHRVQIPGSIMGVGLLAAIYALYSSFKDEV